MRFFIKTFGLFVLVLLLTYPALLFLWGSYIPKLPNTNFSYLLGSVGHMHTRLQEVEEFSRVDVLVLGSSHAYRGFDPRIFANCGLSSFNLGSSAQTPNQTQVLLTRYLDKLNPKIIIYEVYPGAFSIDGIESSLDLISNSVNDINTLKLVFKANHLMVFNTFIFDSMRELFGLNSDYKEQIVKGPDTYIHGGYVEKEIQFFKNEQHFASEWKFNEDQFSAFRNNITMISDKGIELYLVYSPITKSLYDSYLNNQTFDSIMRNSGQYLNFNEILYVDDSLHFFDADHLNQLGVLVFNEKLLELIDICLEE